MDVTVAEGIHALANDTLALASEEAPRTELDPFIKMEGYHGFNGGLQTVFTNFRQVDYQSQIAVADKTIEATMVDYIVADVNFPMHIVYPGLSNMSPQAANNRQYFNNE